MIENSRHVDWGTVREMSAVCEVKTHECVSGLQACHHDSHIGLCP